MTIFVFIVLSIALWLVVATIIPENGKPITMVDERDIYLQTLDNLAEHYGIKDAEEDLTTGDQGFITARQFVSMCYYSINVTGEGSVYKNGILELEGADYQAIIFYINDYLDAETQLIIVWSNL